MAKKTANINIRIDPETKAGAEQLFAKFGITVTDAVNIFLRQSLMVGGLPFDMRQPAITLKPKAAIQEARDIAAGKNPAKPYASARELFEELLTANADIWVILKYSSSFVHYLTPRISSPNHNNHRHNHKHPILEN
ncbi:MAG: type II toxin-antitoxin system RelB/DinJ family antitoxin [Clostridiales bacterium]|nr:type II toxin-antitoxin system RelB/DinJ family antitoxin [Clostridiales bacterium]